MQKQILRGVTMLMLVGAVALMAALVSAHAQSSLTVAADIPFGFAVGGKSLKAGEYTVRRYTTSGDAVLIMSRDSQGAAIRLTRSIHAANVPEKSKLVFHRYGERYFLSEVWTAGDNTGRQLIKCSEERNLQDQLAAISSKGEQARNSYETVEVIAQGR